MIYKLKKFIRSNQKAFEDLGVSVNNVAEAEKVFSRWNKSDDSKGCSGKRSCMTKR